MTRADWILRPILWFATASTINLIARNSTHAPYANLVVGLACLAAYRARARSAAGLPLLYLSTGGFVMFFAHLTSLAAGLAGGVASAAILFWQGRELQRWIPRPAGRIFGVIAVAVLPLLVGTGLVILIYLPRSTDTSFLFARAIEASLGVFAVIAAATGERRTTEGRSFRLWWMDGTAALAAALVVRLMARGIPLAP